MTNEWENDLCEMDCGNCMASWFCPCFNFGRAAERMRIFPNTDEDKLDSLNAACFAHCLLSCFFGMPCLAVLYQRYQVREKFDIEGDVFTDFLASCCCQCCATSQMNLELKKRSMKQQEDAKRTGFMATAPMQHSLPDDARPATEMKPLPAMLHSLADHAPPTTALQPPEKQAVQQQGSVTKPSSTVTPGMQHDLADHPLPTSQVSPPEKSRAPSS